MNINLWREAVNAELAQLETRAAARLEAGRSVRHVLEVYTARLPHHGCDGYRGSDRLDVTRGTGKWGQAFAPTLELLRQAQELKRMAKGNEDLLNAAWQWYRPRYVEEMRASWRQQRVAWNALLKRRIVTLCCYCGTASRCHRTVLAELLVACGAIYRGERSMEAA